MTRCPSLRHAPAQARQRRSQPLRVQQHCCARGAQARIAPPTQRRGAGQDVAARRLCLAAASHLSAMANAYCATTVLPAEVCAATSTLWPRSRHSAAVAWNESNGKGYSFAGLAGSGRAAEATLNASTAAASQPSGYTTSCVHVRRAGTTGSGASASPAGGCAAPGSSSARARLLGPAPASPSRDGDATRFSPSMAAPRSHTAAALEEGVVLSAEHAADGR